MAVTFIDSARCALRHLSAQTGLLPFIAVVWLLMVVLLLAGCGDKPHQQAAPPRPVRVVSAPLPAASGEVIRTGEVRAPEEAELGFRLDGRILTRQVDVGDRVVAGQLLATQENDTSRNQLNSAQADLDSARAAEQLASLSLRRMQLLMPGGAIARTQLDSARSDWQSARARRQSSEASLKTAQETLSWSQLTAPADGVITRIGASAGQVVSAGQSVVTMASGNGRDAVFDVADPQAMARQTGSEFTLSMLADPSVVTRGRLRDISPQADAQTRTWRVRITLDNPPPAMALGSSVQLRVKGGDQPMMTLPASALTRTDSRPAVFVVDSKTLILHRRPVAIGRYSSAEIFISAGLNPGETVVIAGVSKLREGEKVATGEGAE